MAANDHCFYSQLIHRLFSGSINQLVVWSTKCLKMLISVSPRWRPPMSTTQIFHWPIFRLIFSIFWRFFHQISDKINKFLNVLHWLWCTILSHTVPPTTISDCEHLTINILKTLDNLKPVWNLDAKIISLTANEYQSQVSVFSLLDF